MFFHTVENLSIVWKNSEKVFHSVEKTAGFFHSVEKSFP